MPCPTYGDGSRWGDGDLWCRIFDSAPHMAKFEQLVARVAAEVRYSGGDFKIDRLTPLIRGGPITESAYRAPFDTDAGEYVSIEVTFSGAEFKIDTLRLVAQPKHKHTGA